MNNQEINKKKYNENSNNSNREFSNNRNNKKFNKSNDFNKSNKFDNKQNYSDQNKNNRFNKHDLNSKKSSEVSNELLLLKKEMETLKEKFNNLQAENISLKNEISKANEDFINKIAAKSIEAKDLVLKKQEELEKRFANDFNVKLLNYFEKKINPLLDSINQFNRIINSNVSSDEVRNYLVGFQMISDLFERSLNDMDVYKISINIGDIFNEEYMSAFEVVDNSSQSSNCIVDIISPAYRFQDKVIKYALVKVQK